MLLIQTEITVQKLATTKIRSNMSLDGAFIFILKKELSSLIDSRVDKIHMPSKDEIIISFRTREGVKRLLMSANPSSARVCLTKNAPENPPPMLCMLMRKHLANSRLTDIKQINLRESFSSNLKV